MKIFVLTTDLDVTNGWGRYSRDLLQALSQKGVTTVVATRRSDVVDAQRDTQHLLPDPMNYGRSYLCAMWYAWILRTHVADCDIIHAFAEPYSYIAYWLALFSGKKYVITAHGTYSVLPYTLTGYMRHVHAYSFRRAASVVCISSYTKNILEGYGLKNLTVIPNGLQFEKFYTTAPRPDKERDTYLLSVGALKYRKGIHIALAAFAEARRAVKGLRYRIVGGQGDTAYVARLKELVRDLALEDAVEFLGPVSDDELAGLYHTAKLFVLTPVSEGAHFEGFGLVYLEASASGLPVIGSLGSGAEEAIQDGVTGLLVSQGDAASTARAMVRILESDELAQTFGTHGIQWAREHDWGTIVGRYLTLYRSVGAL